MLTGHWTSASGHPMTATCHLCSTSFFRSQRSSVDRTQQLQLTGRWTLSVRSFIVSSRARSDASGRTRSDAAPASGRSPAPASLHVSLTGRSPSVRSLPAPASGRRTDTAHCQPQLTGRWSSASGHLRDQSLIHSMGPFSSLFLHRVDPHQLQLFLLCKCANTTKSTPPCVWVLAFHNHFAEG